MKLNSLYIDNYKMLKNFSINFSKDVSILIGINGSGKSTILEAIANIFSDLILNRKSRFGFKLDYELWFSELSDNNSPANSFNDLAVKVELFSKAKGEKFQFQITTENKDAIEAGLFSRIDEIIPSNIVIYYSGLSGYMEKLCGEHEKIQKDEFLKGNTYAKRPFFYYRPENFKMLLLALLSYEFGDIKDYVYDKLQITDLSNFSIKIKKPETNWAKGKKANDVWGAKGVIREFCFTLAQFAKSKIVSDDDNFIEYIFSEKERLYDMKNHYGEEKKMFELLDMAFYEGLLYEIDITLFKDVPFIHQEGVINFNSNSLSEGEQQIIALKGINEVLIQENTLFLFDEPDTFLHPQWQSSFISEIQQYSKNVQFIITTHSPQLLSNANPILSEVQIIEDGEIVKITPKYYGRDISTILYELMGVERRNKKVTKELSNLFLLIDDEDSENAKLEYQRLSDLLGVDDPAIIRAKTQLNYLEESKNETNQ